MAGGGVEVDAAFVGDVFPGGHGVAELADDDAAVGADADFGAAGFGAEESPVFPREGAHGAGAGGGVSPAADAVVADFETLLVGFAGFFAAVEGGDVGGVGE